MTYGETARAKEAYMHFSHSTPTPIKLALLATPYFPALPYLLAPLEEIREKKTRGGVDKVKNRHLSFPQHKSPIGRFGRNR